MFLHKIKLVEMTGFPFQVDEPVIEEGHSRCVRIFEGDIAVHLEQVLNIVGVSSTGKHEDPQLDNPSECSQSSNG